MRVILHVVLLPLPLGMTWQQSERRIQILRRFNLVHPSPSHLTWAVARMLSLLRYSFSCRLSPATKLCCRRYHHHRRCKLPAALLPASRQGSWRSMASGGDQFPPQRQERQPGKEHAMDPTPQFSSPDYKPSNKLQGRVALVTGGDSGIGRAVCHSFAQEGATVAFTYVKGQEDKDAQDVIQILKQAKTPDAKDPMAVAADLGFDENCKRVVDEVINAYGRIDILVNNAGEQYECNTVEEIDEARLERVFRTNIFSQFFMVR